MTQAAMGALVSPGSCPGSEYEPVSPCILKSGIEKREATEVGICERRMVPTPVIQRKGAGAQHFPLKIQDILKAGAVTPFPSSFPSLLATFNLFQSHMASGNNC